MTSVSAPARAERIELLRLAAPLAAQQVGFQLMGMVDALVLGRYSGAALAGAGVGNNLLFAITSIGLGIVMGMDTVVPQALGAGRPGDARRACSAGVRLAVVVGLVATALVMVSPVVLDLAGVEPSVAAQARPYVYVRALGSVPFLITIALRCYLAAHGRTRPLIVAMLAGNAVNAVLDVALVFGIAPLHVPALGVIGAATSTTIVQVVTAAIFAYAARAIDSDEPRPIATRADISAIVRFGGPVGAQIFAEVGIFGIATIAAGRLGEVPAAAHSIALNLASFTFSAAFGLASATSVRVGHAVGAGDLALARRRGAQGLAFALAIMACAAATFVVLPRVLAAAFTSDRDVIAATVPLLQIAALFQLSDGAQAIGAGALRGLGHTRATFVGNVIGHYAIGLPIMLGLGFGLALGAPGLWWGLSAGLTVTAAYLVAQFLAYTRVR